MTEYKDLSLSSILDVVKNGRAEINQEFRELCDEAIEKANKLFKGSKDRDYNSGGVMLSDYFDCIGDSVRAAFCPVWRKTLRVKSLLSSGNIAQNESLKQNAIDAINYWRFFYAALVIYEKIMSEKKE